MKELLKHKWLLVVLFLALGLRLPLLNGSFWLDEAAQALESIRPFSQQFQIIADFQPPLMHLIVHFALSVSRSEWWLRLWGALLPGLGSIACTYYIGKKLWSPKVGLLAALLLATSAFHIYFSQELRPYTLPTFWATLSWLSVLEWQAASQIKTHRSWWLVWIITSLLGLYSSYLYPFLWLSQIVWLVWQRQKWSSVITGAIVVGLGFLPWLPTFLRQLAAGQALKSTLPGWQNVVSTSQLKTPALVLGKFLFGQQDLSLNYFWVTIVALLFIVVSIAFYTRKKMTVQSSNWRLLVIWLIVPSLLAWLVSFWVPVIQPKRVLFLLPAFYLGITTILDSTRLKWLSWLELGLFLTINLYSTAMYYTHPEFQRENWRSLIQQLQNQYPINQTAAVFAFDEPFAPWRWYADYRFKTISTGKLSVSDPEQVASAIAAAKNYRYLIIFDYLTDLSDPQGITKSTIEAWGYKPGQIITYPQIGFTRIYNQSQSTVANAVK